MNKKLIIACHSILSAFSKAEVEKIIEVLSHFNKKCKEESRAACLLHGCKDSDSPLEKEIAKHLGEQSIVENFSKKAAASYSGPSKATCSKCGAPL
jgi:hypothetical protein